MTLAITVISTKNLSTAATSKLHYCIFLLLGGSTYLFIPTLHKPILQLSQT